VSYGGTTVIGMLAPDLTRGMDCDGSQLYTVKLNAPAGRARGQIEGGPWNCFWITSGFGEDWTTPSPTTDEFEYRLDDGPACKVMLGSWVRTGSFRKFNVLDKTTFHFSDVDLRVFLTRAPAFFAFYENDNTGVNGWF